MQPATTVRRVSTPRPLLGGRGLVGAAALAVCLAAVSGPQPLFADWQRPPSGEATQTVAAAPSLATMIGQKLVVAMKGTQPSDDLLGRIQRGEVGGVILFGANIRSAIQLSRATHRLRAAAADGGQPPLLITTDQEGGAVRRVPWAPPTLSPPQMGAIGSTSTAFDQGKATAHVLACAGVNGNLAPVADVPKTTDSFLYQQGRTWSFDSSLTASLSDAFASGTEAGGAIPAMKHFPGLGRAVDNTDLDVVTIRTSASNLGPGLRPYRRAIDHAIPMVMLSNATYTAYDPAHAAGWSHAISVGLLRETLGFAGVTITDSLNGTANARGVSPSSLAIKAAAAGTDMILLTGSEGGSRAAYQALLDAAGAGRIPRWRLRDSYDRILAMKDAFPRQVSDETPPRVDAPASSLVTGVTLGSGTTAVQTTWAGRDGCAISAFAVERRSGSGDWVAQALPGSTATGIVQGLRFGLRYRFQVAATDGAGNTSDPVLGPTFRPRRSEESDDAITYHGTWHAVEDSNASGGALAYSQADDAKASFTFTGLGVSWVAVRGPTRGQAAIWIDGTWAGRVDLHASARHARQVVFARSWATSGAHRITVVNLGTADHSRVDVDAFVTLAGS